jgi:hypothetical protein
MQEEKNKIEAEKAENAKMLEELRALKAQLEGQQAASAAAPEEKPAEEKPAEEKNETSETPEKEQ